MSERDALRRALQQAPPYAPVPADRAAQAVLAGRRRVRRRRVASATAIAAVVATVALLPTSLDWFRGEPGAPIGPAASSTTQPPGCESAPGNHVDLVSGTAVEIRFCRTAGTWNGVVHTPTVPLTEGVSELVAGWTTAPPGRCEFDPASDQYRFQVVYDDGSVARINGATGECQPIVNGATTIGTTGLDVFSQVMAAYGEQFAADYPSVQVAAPPLSCPADPRHPETTDRRGPSAELQGTGLVIPLPVEVGVLCVDARPYTLDHTELQLVRVALQTITTGPPDCVSPNDTTYSLVLQDKTGTRRTISSIGAECGAVVTGFPEGPSGDPGQLFPRLLDDLAR